MGIAAQAFAQKHRGKKEKTRQVGLMNVVILR
jgi:hypothetical protein